MLKVYLAPDLELPDMTQMVIESGLAGNTEKDRQPRCTDKQAAIRRGIPRLLSILNKAWLKGDTVKIEIDNTRKAGTVKAPDAPDSK